MTKDNIDGLTVVIKVHYRDWKSFNGYCEQVGHGNATKVFQESIISMLHSGILSIQNEPSEGLTKRSGSYWEMFTRQWVFFLASTLAVAVTHLLMRLPLTARFAPPDITLYLLAAAMLVSGALYFCAHGLESNRRNANGPKIVEILRYIEFLWIVPFGLLLLAVIISMLPLLLGSF